MRTKVPGQVSQFAREAVESCTFRLGHWLSVAVAVASRKVCAQSCKVIQIVNFLILYFVAQIVF